MCKNANSFYWHLYGKHKPLVGNRNQYEYEVSVVVPVYNISDYVDQCIESLVKQTLGSLEVLVVDDGTPDDSGDKADIWAEKYPGRVKVIHKPNGGCASARNAGLQQAKGQYIGFVDGDDWVEPHMYEELYRSAILSTSDIAQSGYQEVYETGEVIKFPLSVHMTRMDLLRERPTMWRRIYSSQMLRSKNITFLNTSVVSTICRSNLKLSSTQNRLVTYHTVITIIAKVVWGKISRFAMIACMFTSQFSIGYMNVIPNC